MAATKKTRGRIWENQETILLLQKWGDENIQMRLKSCTRKKPIWQEISEFLRASGYEDRDEEGCKTRIHTLISAYRTYKDECAKTGNGTPKKKPAFFNEVDELLSEKPCTKPKLVISSSQIVMAGPLDSAESADEENVENTEPNLPCCSSDNKHSKPHKDPCVTETTTDEKLPVVFTTKKRKMSTTDAFSKIDKALEAFIMHQQAADKNFLEAEEARERREQEREEKRRKEDQEFLLKLAQVLRK